MKIKTSFSFAFRSLNRIFANETETYYAMAIDKVEYWKHLADEDIGVAEDLFKAKRWMYVAFMCHQAIEKALKA